MIIPFVPKPFDAETIAKVFADRAAALQAGYREGIEAAARIVECTDRPDDSSEISAALQLAARHIRTLA